MDVARKGILELELVQCSVHNLVAKSIIHHCRKGMDVASTNVLSTTPVKSMVSGILDVPSQVPMFYQCPQPCNKSIMDIIVGKRNTGCSQESLGKYRMQPGKRNTGCSQYQCSVMEYIIVGKRNTGCSQVPMFCPQPCNKSIIHHCRKAEYWM
ncbi:unnamed protein product [Mytilus edulis]|uniref:Uncharacterized protein n=1 Tax=Mytilus edulis TaxID=6550 RepID=A0A8S3T8E0_MYTED|nr:unnamed protein product [Mytilus edulis]